MADPRQVTKRATGVGEGPAITFSIPVLAVTLLTALGSVAVVLALPATVSWGAVLVVAGAGGVFATRLAAARPDPGIGRAELLLELADAPAKRDLPALPRLPGAWGALYEKVTSLVQEARTARSAVAELERFRRHVELATAAYREEKDPLAASEDLRSGPLHDLLDAAAQRKPAAGPVVSRIPLGEDELVGVDGEPFPVPWPAPEGAGSTVDASVRAELRRDVEELVAGLAGVESLLGAGVAPVEGPGPAVRAPAQLVDAVVHTAADGIEDLAAGLMRANELLSVAERVTNRATLLALNAALEATRSGSEAFAAIAEETRRLAEFAREATDTISRLANEIEYKVGETIHAIHQTSEDAKTALAALGSAPPPSTGAPAPSREEVAALLATARRLESALAAAPAPPAAPGTGAPPAEEDAVAGEPSQPAASPPPEHGGEPEPAGPPADADSSAAAPPAVDASVREDPVENDRPASETGNTKDFLLLEGLEPGSRMTG